ncbi:hypothetical protein BDW59DRAFT_4785 [Aspergillus cavernicola]|uniref:Amine oxidase domain-containing protein n=1 Tax=Aspergillus cavernicola TaxID=176166 RepID=A0ABR4J557_9EURO
MELSKPRKVAIVGGGLTGIAAFWALQGSCHDVHMFEASSTLGGHMKTLLLESSGNQVQVDLEMPTFNPKACPNLVSLLYHLMIPTTAAPFSFGVLEDTAVLKWHISILKSIILCPQILCKLETYRLLLDAVSLRYLGANVLAKPAPEAADVQDLTDNYLSDNGYSESFRDRYLVPLLSMLWRTNAGRFLPRLPVKALARSLSDHQLLSTYETMPKWRRIDPGVRRLIEAMTKHFPREKLHLQTKVSEIARHSKSQYNIVTFDGQQSRFDHVILTVDGLEILRLLGSTVNAEEKDILQGLGVTRNIGVLHSEYPSITDNATPGYNYIMASRDHQQQDLAPPKSCLMYDVNIIQDIPASRFGDVLVTLNPLSPPHPSVVQAVWEFTEAEPSADSLHAQSLLSSIQNKRGLSYGFCWTGRGLLEDAITSGLRMVVGDLGATVPFPVIFHPEPLASVESLPRRSGLWDNMIKTTLQAVRLLVLVSEILLLLLVRLHSQVRARLSSPKS